MGLVFIEITASRAPVGGLGFMFNAESIAIARCTRIYAKELTRCAFLTFTGLGISAGAPERERERILSALLKCVGARGVGL